MYTNTHTHRQPSFFLAQITSKHRKLKRLPFKYHSHHGESTLTIQRTLHPQKGHHQIPAANLPPNIKSNFIIMFNIQYRKYRILNLY